MKEPAGLLLHSRPVDDADPVRIAVEPQSAGWEYTSLVVRRFAEGERYQGESGPDEIALVTLGGRCRVSMAGASWEIGARATVFQGKPWAVYLPPNTGYEIVALTELEVAIGGARADVAYPPRLITPDDIDVEIRGGGNAARQINHIIKPEFPAHRLLIVEVFTPSGNWSSYPPHKHDVSRMPVESDLEEIYYYRIAPADGFGLQRLYTSDGRIDQAYVIKDGDLLLVPEGYHAFAVAQGYTGYYLNILAGDEPVRTMQPADDPAYAWVRGTWTPEINQGASTWQEIDRRVNRGAGRRD